MKNLDIRFGDIGFVATFPCVRKDGSVIDLTVFDTNYLQVKGQADRALTVVSTGLGTCSWTTVSTDWLGSKWIKAGAYVAQIKLTDAATPTVVILSEPFVITIKGAFEE